jgi:hypothetical protein
MKTNLVGIAALVSALVTSTSCSSMVGPGEQLADARVRWAERGPDAYSMTVMRGCECLPEVVGPAIVTVENGAISARYASTGAPVPMTYAGAFPNVEGLFDLIEQAQKDNYDDIDVEYDQELGYPIRISLDRDKRAIDDEMGVYVRDFKTN